jgi:hypothetical protein
MLEPQPKAAQFAAVSRWQGQNGDSLCPVRGADLEILMQTELNECFRLGTSWNGTDEQMIQLEMNPDQPVVESTTGIRSRQCPNDRLYYLAVDDAHIMDFHAMKVGYPDYRAAPQGHEG